MLENSIQRTSKKLKKIENQQRKLDMNGKKGIT